MCIYRSLRPYRQYFFVRVFTSRCWATRESSTGQRHGDGLRKRGRSNKWTRYFARVLQRDFHPHSDLSVQYNLALWLSSSIVVTRPC